MSLGNDPLGTEPLAAEGLASNRASAFNYCNAWDSLLPPVDGEISAKDRQHLWGAYSAYTLSIAAPTFTGTIDDISLELNADPQVYDYSSYFTDATSYSISPAVPASWNFDTSTCILTVTPDEVGTYGDFTITATNVTDSVSSNAFTVTVTESAFSGGYLPFTDRPPRKLKRKEEKEVLEPIIEALAQRVVEATEIDITKDIEVALRLKVDQERLVYKNLYLTWLKQEVAIQAEIKKRKRRKDEESLIMLLLH